MNTYFSDCENLPTPINARALHFVLCALLSSLFWGWYAHAETVRFGILALPPTLGNPNTAMGIPSGHFWGSLYDGLTTISKDGAVSPSLALSWAHTQPTRWVFTLRQDVKFHNGASFDAQSVVTTIDFR